MVYDESEVKDFIRRKKMKKVLFAAGALVIAVPITILYISFQKYLIEGMTAGATKG